MRVRNKLESINIIKGKKLNSFPEELFKKGQEDKIRKFLKQYPVEFYAIRSKDIVDCKKNNFKVPYNHVLDEAKKFNLFSINVSSYNYISSFVLIGDIMIGRNNDVWFIGSKNKNYTGKMAESNPDFNYCTDIYDKKLNYIPGFDLIYSYILNHSLMDVIVEFAIYNKPIGMYKEQVIIFEIRTDF